jgi:glucose-6-phosphate 1-dehydrogenase
VLEKPFGESLSDAVELNQLLSGLYPERSIFRVDHFLAMGTVLNLLGVRLANRVLEPIWSSAHIERVDIVLGRIAGAFGPGRVLRRRRRAQGHAAEPPAAAAVPGRMEPPISLGDRTCATARWTSCARSGR